MNSYKFVKGVVGILAVVSLAACSSNPKEEVAEVPDCTFPDAPEIAAPAWICDEVIDGFPVSAVGSYRPTKAGHQFQKTQAVAAGRNALASRMKVHVKQMVKNYVETTGVGDDETVDAVTTDVSKQITSETLYGTRAVKTRKSPNGTLYVLVAMDSADTAKAAQEALKSSYKNQKAMWQKMMADRSFAELDAEIEKIANQNISE